MTRRLKVAVLSFAHVHAWSYVSALAGRDDVDLLTSDPDGVTTAGEGPRGADFAAGLGVAYAADYDEVFAWLPDAVIVCSENSRHIELVRRAAAAGANVLCEKPLATTVADAEEIVQLIEHTGIRLMTAFPMRFTSAFSALRSRVRAGTVGEIVGVLGTNNGKIPTGDRAWFTDPAYSGGGALVDHVVHCADLLDDLLGERPITVRAAANGILHADLGLDVETGGIVTLTYPSGIVASIDCSWSQPLQAAEWGGVTLQVTGSAGTLTMDAFARSIGGTDANGGVWLPVAPDPDQAMIAHFLDSLRSGDVPLPDARAGLRAVRIVAAALESARTDSTVKL